MSAAEARAAAAEAEVERLRAECERLRRERDHALRSLIRERAGVAAPMERRVRRGWVTP